MPRQPARTASIAASICSSICWLAIAAVIAPHTAAAAACWPPPVEAPVADPFREPACPWCPGNRGIEYATPAGVAVRAVAAGEVTYAGAIDGVGYVVVRHADGRRVTYGRLTDRRVDRGDRVVARMIVGLTAGRLHLGLRHGDRYVDPAPFLGRFVGRPRLVPVAGGRANPAPPPRLRCDAPTPVTNRSLPAPDRSSAVRPMSGRNGLTPR